MILLAIVAWVLLTACGEYLMHEASFLDGWRRSLKPGCAVARMLACFSCPWGWCSLPAGGIIYAAACVVASHPWAIAPFLAVLLPALGLGLARIVALLSPLAAQQKSKGG